MGQAHAGATTVQAPAVSSSCSWDHDFLVLFPGDRSSVPALRGLGVPCPSLALANWSGAALVPECIPRAVGALPGGQRETALGLGAVSPRGCGTAGSVSLTFPNVRTPSHLLKCPKDTRGRLSDDLVMGCRRPQQPSASPPADQNKASSLPEGGNTYFTAGRKDISVFILNKHCCIAMTSSWASDAWPRAQAQRGTSRSV